MLRIVFDQLPLGQLLEQVKNCHHEEQEIISRVVAQLCGSRQEETEGVPQLGRCGTDFDVDVAVSQPMHEKRIRQAQGHRLVLRFGIALLDARLQFHGGFDNRLNLGHFPKLGSAPDRAPITVKTNQSRPVLRNGLVEQLLYAPG